MWETMEQSNTIEGTGVITELQEKANNPMVSLPDQVRNFSNIPQRIEMAKQRASQNDKDGGKEEPPADVVKDIKEEMEK